MQKKLLTLAIAFLLSLTCSFEANAQTRRRTPPRRVVKRVKPKIATVVKPSAAAIKTASGLTYIITKRGTGRLPKKLVMEMIDDSYALVVSGLPKKDREFLKTFTE